MMAIKPPNYDAMQKPHHWVQRVTARKLTELIGEYTPGAGGVEAVCMTGRPACIYNAFVHAEDKLTDAEERVLMDMVRATFGEWFRGRIDYVDGEVFALQFSPYVEKHFMEGADEPKSAG